MGSRLPITTASKVFFAGAALLLLGACATGPVEPETGGAGQKVSSAQVLSICEKLAKSKDTRLAIGLCEKAHMEDQQNPVPLLLLGDMLQQQGSLAQAGRAYGMAIDLDPENVEAHYGLGKVFLARNQFDLAIEQFEVARELNTRDHRLYNALGVVLDNLGDHIAAQAHYKIGLELAPNNHALQKNLMLSRRLDSSVTTPAIGPRHKVVPRPVSPQSAPGAAPEAVPGESAPASPGRLGHEPLAQAPVPVVVPVGKSFAAAAVDPAPHAPEAKVSDETETPRRGQEPLASTKVPTAENAGVDAKPLEPTAVAIAQPRLIPLPPRAKPLVPADSVLNTALREEKGTSQPVEMETLVASVGNSQIAVSTYDEIPLPDARPAAVEPRLSIRAKQGPTILASGFNSAPVEAEALPALKPVPQPRQTARLLRTEPETATGEVSVASVETLAASKAIYGQEVRAAEQLSDVEVETLVREPAATVAPSPSRDTQSLSSDEAGNLLSASLSSDSMSSRAGEDHFLSETVSGDFSAPRGLVAVPAKLAPERRAEKPAPLSLVPQAFLQTASLTGGDAAVLGDGSSDPVETEITAATPNESRRRVAKLRQRFGREHEEDHETRQVEGEFWDLVDVVNPMQHIPVIATIYRDVTEDEIKPAAKIAGGTLFGGVLGFASSLVDSMIEEASGQDIGETALAALSQPNQEAPDEAALALDARHEELRLAHARGR